MDEISKYYRYIHLCNLESINTLTYFFNFIFKKIYIMLYIILQKYIYISKRTTILNANKKISQIFLSIQNKNIYG